MEARDPLTEQIIGAAIEIHRVLGPGLLESAYEVCLAYDLVQMGLEVQRQSPLSLVYKDIKLDQVYRLDLVVERRVVIELKTVEKLLPIHQAQLLTYLKLGGYKTGLLLNFQSAVLKDGIRRVVHTLSSSLCCLCVSAPLWFITAMTGFVGFLF